MSSGTVKVKVRDGWAVFDGHQQRGGGETVTVDAKLAEEWRAAGWVDPVKVPASTRLRRQREEPKITRLNG